MDIPQGYRVLAAQEVAPYLAGLPDLAARLGGSTDTWRVREVSDGNLNTVFVVEGPSGALCVKQALPYVRVFGPDWPLAAERAAFEHTAMTAVWPQVGRLIPEPYHFDPRLFVIVMEYLSPHIIMRRGMIAGTVYPRFAEEITDYLAKTLFFSSDLFLPAAVKKTAMATFCANVELCKITEDLIFTDPYIEHERNRWTSPQLDDDARAVRADAALKTAVAYLKHAFLNRPESLLHGDMHTGSIMVTEDETRIIDPEFAFYGPMAFDVGKLIGNFLLCYFSQDGHEDAPGARDDYRRWILTTTERIWDGFATKFLALWAEHASGDAYPPVMFHDSAGQTALDAAKRQFMARHYKTALGYAGCSMIRRTLGFAHNADLETIEDVDLRARCERRTLRLARALIVEPDKFPTMVAVSEAATRVRAGDRP